MRLTSEQRYVLREIVRLPKSEIVLGGRAGTGKTTVIRHLTDLLEEFVVCAYTGKAVNVLKSKGVQAKTIHSLIYKAYTDAERKVFFSLTNDLECKGIIVDEASMVSRVLYEDLRSFGKPIIFVGDHGQLEPVGDDFNLMKEPDYRLETIHRNAGEIAHFAEYIRQGYRPSSWQVRNGSSRSISFLPRGRHSEALIDADQTICAYNKTRAEVNSEMRRLLGRGLGLEVGDRVMCLRNDSRAALFNGMQGFVRALYSGDRMDFESEGATQHVAFDPKIFGQVKYELDRDRDSPMPFDYSYCVTAHKAQGSEWDSVLVLEQRCDLWDHRRWAYTSASRARDRLFWCEA